MVVHWCQFTNFTYFTGVQKGLVKKITYPGGACEKKHLCSGTPYDRVVAVLGAAPQPTDHGPPPLSHRERYS